MTDDDKSDLELCGRNTIGGTGVMIKYTIACFTYMTCLGLKYDGDS